MSIEIQNFTGAITRITAGGSGQQAVDKFNQPLSEIESYLNMLASRIAGLHTKSAIVRKYAPLSADVFAGALVYYNPAEGHSRFEPAIASLLALPGDQGESVESPMSRVEGIVLSVDTDPDGTNTVLGTLLCGGYWEDSYGYPVLSGMLGSAAGTPGTYYLSPVNAGHAVADTGGHLRQAVLSNYGGGKFSMGHFYLAHDNHFHSSFALDSAWVSAASPPAGVSSPSGAVRWYDGSGDPDYIGIGELSARTTAVFHDGVLQGASDDFVVYGGYLWHKGGTAPEAGSVVIFNHYPFAYGNAIVRSVESTNNAISVRTRNGFVQITANDFRNGSTARSATALSGISGDALLYTPVVSEISQGPGIVVDKETDGSVVVSSAGHIGTHLDAYSINHNGTNVTSDGKFLYLTYPQGRSGSAMVISMPVTGVDAATALNAYVWGSCLGSGASFTVQFYWAPHPVLGESEIMPTAAAGSSTLSFSGGSGLLTLAETPGYITINGSGMLSAVVTISGTPGSDIRLLRIGFKLAVESV